MSFLGVEMLVGFITEKTSFSNGQKSSRLLSILAFFKRSRNQIAGVTVFQGRYPKASAEPTTFSTQAQAYMSVFKPSGVIDSASQNSSAFAVSNKTPESSCILRYLSLGQSFA